MIGSMRSVRRHVITFRTTEEREHTGLVRRTKLALLRNYRIRTERAIAADGERHGVKRIKVQQHHDLVITHKVAVSAIEIHQVFLDTRLIETEVHFSMSALDVGGYCKPSFSNERTERALEKHCMVTCVICHTAWLQSGADSHRGLPS